MRIYLIIICWLALCVSGCEKIAIMSTPAKKAQTSHTKLAVEAERYFWKIFYHSRYQDIPEANRLLMAAYLENSNDPKIAARLGFLHLWKITERARTGTLSPLIPNQVVLSKKYFKDAVQLDPKNAIYRGFYGDTFLVEGQIFKDKREEVRGYFILKDAIRRWPEFNYFTAGYPMSSLPVDSKHFKEGLKWQWKTLDLCAGRTVNRSNPDFGPYMVKETTVGPKRACWNSTTAPHNFEGFFMNMGDMLVKSGNVDVGIKIYKNAKLSKSFSSWPYKEMLEKRILNAKANVSYFQKNSNHPDRTVMFNSGYGCMACHRKLGS